MSTTTKTTIAALVAALTLAACGGDDTDVADDADGAAADDVGAAAGADDLFEDDEVAAGDASLNGGPDDFPDLPFPDDYPSFGATWLPPENGGGDNGGYLGNLEVTDTTAPTETVLADLQAFYEGEGFETTEVSFAGDLSMTNGEVVITLTVTGERVAFFASTP